MNNIHKCPRHYASREDISCSVRFGEITALSSYLKYEDVFYNSGFSSLLQRKVYKPTRSTIESYLRESQNEWWSQLAFQWFQI